MAGALLALSCSYSFSDTVNGTTNNAASNGFVWDMTDVLPPEAGLSVNGLFYRYTVEKDPNSDMTVTIQNEHLYEPGYVIQETDDWSQLPGATINKSLTFGNISREIIGQGSIEVTGEGEVLDPSVQYSYTFDPCYIILSNPECPGYSQALYDWLKENGLLDQAPDVDDPFYDEWVQMMLNSETEKDEDEETVEAREEDEEDEDPIEALNADVDIEGFVDGARQSAIMLSFSTIPKFDSYYSSDIPGGVYEDTVTLQDAELPDNRRALSDLASDSLHRDMVRSQYENN